MSYFTADPRTMAQEGYIVHSLKFWNYRGQSHAPAPKKDNLTRLEDVLSMGGGLDQSNPIILVLTVPTAGALSLDNAKEFFEKGTYE